MAKFSYTIFDADPNTSGSCEWPDHQDVEIKAATVEAAMKKALAVARREGEACGEYATGDVLYVLLSDENDVIHRGTYTIQGEG